MRVPRPARPLTPTLSPSGGEGIERAPSPSVRERVGVRVAPVFTHSPGYSYASPSEIVEGVRRLAQAFRQTE
jgi:hypothetical protein